MTRIENYTQTDVLVNQTEELDPIVVTPDDEDPIVVTPDDDDTGGGIVIVTPNISRRDTLKADIAEAMTTRLQKNNRTEGQRRFEQRKAMQKEAVLKDLTKQDSTEERKVHEEFRA